MKRIAVAAVCGALLAGLYALVQAGNLEPPGPPAPTMRTLEQLDPGTPILASDLPLTISAAGRYYLAEEVSTSGAGITITAEGVTLDLMGHVLAGGTGDGISIAPGLRSDITIKNGTVRDWAGHGLNLELGGQVVVMDIKSLENGGNGIVTGARSRIVRCEASANDQTGILVTDISGSVIDSLVTSNGAGGISIGDGVIRGCIASFNTGVGIAGGPIVTIADSEARNNTGDGFYVLSGTVTGCTANQNEKYGIYLSNGVIRDSLAAYNDSDGINVENHAHVLGNQCTNNGLGGMGAGIHTTSYGNRIEGNNVAGNVIGIDIDGGGNVIIKNSAAFNSSNDYDIIGTNDVGPIGSASSSTSPWANISY